LIFTKTGLRVSFLGGSSDLPSYYNKKDGLCISTTIDSFIYITLHRCIANHLKIIYSKLELKDNVNDIEHDRVRETLKYFNILSNIEMCSFSNMTLRGTGLGSSSSFTVGIINALYYAKYGKYISKRELANLAAYIEIDKCNAPIGLQDQYAASFGGFNSYRFNKNEVIVEPVHIHSYKLLELEDSLLFYNTNIPRSSSDILNLQNKDIENNSTTESINNIVNIAESGLKLLQSNSKLNEFGKLLDDSWKIKRNLSNVTNEYIDEMYETAIKAGALGGKLLGAGGGGFLMIFVPANKKEKVIESMKHYEKRQFKFYKEGSTLEVIK
jgi:D-glycero-alpha-D-manno-heptose-7-phosphate kinase